MPVDSRFLVEAIFDDETRGFALTKADQRTRHGWS
ncbi:hypothetical protein N185_23250 [Sinorhizobium sp. GW3]|nr:hypothetical protein N185_23250 [Sinorhizobium sp. GW3]KSV77437.1 hypothetical protein N182_22930 [Sinorhizobium sp. GL2]